MFMNTVLIVEDEMLEQEFLKSITSRNLSPEDRVLTCESGVEAIQLAKQYNPNIIIMDIVLTEMDGLSAISEIRAFLPDSCITILSACSNFSYAQKAISLEVFEYLLKPVKPKVFEDVFQQMLDFTTEQSPKTTKYNKDIGTDSEDCQYYIIQEAVQYIKEHFREKLTLEIVASKTFMSSKYFSQLFKKQTGTSFSKYVNDLRIEHACRLLETTNYPAYRISMECGFSDPSYFNRVFTATMNTTPINYRKSRLANLK